MSLETWKAEFYPKPAKDVKAEDAVAHSLQKWRGLRKENLEKHGLERDVECLQDESCCSFVVDADSCALCVHHLTKQDSCASCPLAKARGGVACDDSWNGISKVLPEIKAEDVPPYQVFTLRGDPEPMIYWLEKCN